MRTTTANLDQQTLVERDRITQAVLRTKDLITYPFAD